MSRSYVTPSAYNSIYSKKLRNNLFDELDAEILGKEITELKTTGFLSEAEPQRYASILKRFLPIKDEILSRYFLDLGCGFGVFGRWLAERIDASLFGVDYSEVAIRGANELAAGHANEKHHYVVADFSALPLRAGAISAAFSLDSLYLAKDPHKTLGEIQRVLIPGGLLFFTLYENFSSPDVYDYFSLNTWMKMLEQDDFQVVEYNDATENWRDQMTKKHSLRWKEREKILNELGGEADAELNISASMLGFNSKRSFIESTSRYEVIAVSGNR